MSYITNYTKEIQRLKQYQLATYQQLEKSRNSVLSKDLPDNEIYRSVSLPIEENPELQEENQKLVESLTEDTESLQNTQRAASELNNLLSFFSQKVIEHEEITQTSKF